MQHPKDWKKMQLKTKVFYVLDMSHLDIKSEISKEPLLSMWEKAKYLCMPTLKCLYSERRVTNEKQSQMTVSENINFLELTELYQKSTLISAAQNL